MSDLVYDGTDLWARVKWRIKGGAVIDASKVMLVDSGAPFTGISASNLHPSLTIIGLALVQILGCVGDALVLAGGEMAITIDGTERTCSKPVRYSPCFKTDILGLDQLIELGILRGVTVKGTPRPPGISLPPISLGVVGSAVLQFLTIAPGTVPFAATPRPGLFSFSGGLTPQGEYASAQLAFEHHWPALITFGAEFEVVAAFIAKEELEFVAVSFAVPHGFKVVGGEPSASTTTLRAGQSEMVRVRLVAPRHAGDYHWETTVRIGTLDGQEVARVPGCVVVREHLNA